MLAEVMNYRVRPILHMLEGLARAEGKSDASRNEGTRRAR